MRRLHVTVVDLTTERPARALYARLMNATLAGIRPQVVAVWCEQAGHHVHYVCYTGFEDLPQEVLGPADIVFIGAFTQAAHTAYAISDLHRRRGAITVLRGPHARCSRWTPFTLDTLRDALVAADAPPTARDNTSCGGQATWCPGLTHRRLSR